MAQVNITLSQEELLHVLSGNREEAFKMIVQKILNEIMLAESEEQLGAARHERTEGRTDYRNGTRERPLTTRIGTITLSVPRHRNQPFHTMIFDNYSRSEAALISAMAEMVVCGVSTRKISKITELLCGESFSKSTVSELCRNLDEDIERFRTRTIDEPENCPFLIVDATYFKARVDHKIVSRAFLVAVGVRVDGRKEVLGFNVYDAENNESWSDFLGSLRKRGLNQVSLIVSDAHKSILHAAAKVYPDAAWQRCQFHFIRNILDAVPKKYQAGMHTELSEMFKAANVEEARKIKDSIASDYGDVAEKAVDILENGFEDAVTVMMLPKDYYHLLRTSNAVERLNGELKRRSNVIKIFPNESSVLRLMGAVATEYSERLSAQHTRVYKPSREAFAAETISRLKEIAHQQQSLLLVA